LNFVSHHENKQMSIIFDKTVGLFSSYKEENKYFVYKVTKTDDKVILHYFIDDWSSSWIEDKDTFYKFPQKYKVMSGGWYGDKGRWRTLKRIVREIKCEGVIEFIEQSYSGENSVTFNKKILSSKIEVKVLSEKVGAINFKCHTVSFTDHYQLLAFDMELDKFVDATHLFPGGLKFIGKL
jgi:hypothetical protein